LFVSLRPTRRGSHIEDGEKLLKVSQIADFLGVSKRWVYEEGRKHGLPLYKIGRHLRSREKELERWLRQQRI
jgi:excisionase family DNA binding protein